jgi:hypothetical protein
MPAFKRGASRGFLENDRWFTVPVLPSQRPVVTCLAPLGPAQVAPLPSIEYADDKALLFICLKISVMLGPLLRLFGESKCKFTTRSKKIPAIRPFF